MARPKSEGLKYFSHDVDASNDEKIEAMEALFGLSGYAFFFKMAERVYRAGGELVISDAETRQILANKCRLSVEEWNKMLASALKLNLFDANIFEKKLVLTSGGIKKRCKTVLAKRRKSAEKHRKNKEVSGGVSAETTPIVKERKEKESKGNKKESAAALVDPWFEDLNFKTAWDGWISGRKGKTTPYALKLNLEKLHGLAPDIPAALMILKEAAARGWTGLFPANGNGHQPAGLKKKTLKVLDGH